MRRILLSITLLLWAMITLAQEGQMNSVNQVLYEQAVKALENKSFIIRFYSNSGYADYDDRYCFLEVDGEKVSYQFYDSRADNGPWTGLTHTPVLYYGTASDFRFKKEDNGDVHLTALLKIPYIYRNFRWNIILKEGSNECQVTKNKKGHKSIGYLKGKLYPIGGTSVMKGEAQH